ncbi:MAG: AbrB/MazE/SpoVT family DNA-binding domain-containing protein [Candidatus Hodarchaeales archaeon]
MIFRTRIGKRGEIYTSKKLRNELGFKEGDEIILRIDNNRLLVEKQSSLSDLLDLEPLAVVNIEEIENDLEMMRLEAEKRIEDNEQNPA